MRTVSASLLFFLSVVFAAVNERIPVEFGDHVDDNDKWLKGIQNLTISREALASPSRPVLHGDDGLKETPISSRLRDASVTAALFSAASYCQPDAVKTWTCGERCQGTTLGTRVVDYFASYSYDATGYVAINDSLKQIIVAFRGSESFANWLANMETWKQLLEWPSKSGIPVYVHTGFFSAYNEVANQVRSNVQQLHTEHPDYEVMCTGHSLGGALATLAVADIRQKMEISDSKMRLISFGAPRVGDSSWPAYFRSLLPGNDQVVRWVNKADIVPHVPPAMFGFRHAPQEYWINSSNMAVLCSSTDGEDPNCSDSLLMPNSVTDHLKYLEVQFGPYC